MRTKKTHTPSYEGVYRTDTHPSTHHSTHPMCNLSGGKRQGFHLSKALTLVGNTPTNPTSRVPPPVHALYTGYHTLYVLGS